MCFHTPLYISLSLSHYSSRDASCKLVTKELRSDVFKWEARFPWGGSMNENAKIIKRPKSGLFGLIVPRNNIRFGGIFPLSRSQTNKCLTTDFFFYFIFL